MKATIETSNATRTGRWYKWEVLVLLWMAYLLNQGDRQVFNTVLPAIRDALDLTDTSVGLIATIFNLFYALMVPVGGWVGDHFSRKWVVTLSILFWSVATMFTGFANGFLWLVLLRSVATGGGEAFFGPANYSLLGQYHTSTRAMAMSIHQTSYYVGVILAGWLAGYIADHISWSASFVIFGAAGIVWGAIMILRLRDYPAAEPVEKVAKPDITTGFRTVFTTPTALMLTIAFSSFIFVITGYMTWVPAYLQEEYGLTQASAGFSSMFYTYLAAFIGVLIAGSISDRLARRHPASRMMIQGVGLIGGALFLLCIDSSSPLWFLYAMFAGWGFFRALFDGNIYAVLYDVTPPEQHASCSSAMITTGFAVGAMSPVILGAMKESLGSLSSTFPILAIIWIAAGVATLVIARTSYDKDYNRIH